MSELREFVAELREHWRDSYWWADHQALRAAGVSVVIGIIGLVFAYLQARATRAGLGELPA